MSLGPSAYTVASHATVLVAVLLAFARLQRLRYDADRRRLFLDGWAPSWAAFAVVASLLVERAFFIAARMLAPYGVDLYQAHPAPAALSILVAASIWSVSLATSVSVLERRLALRGAALEASGLAGLWLAMAATLR